MPERNFLFCFVIHKNLVFVFHTLFKRNWNIFTDLIRNVSYFSMWNKIQVHLGPCSSWLSWFLQCVMNNWSLHWNEWKMTNTTHYTWKEVSDLYTIRHKLVPQTHLEKTAYISGYSLLGFLLFVFKKKKNPPQRFSRAVLVFWPTPTHRE